MSKSDQENKVDDMLNDSALEVDIRSVHEKPVGANALHEGWFFLLASTDSIHPSMQVVPADDTVGPFFF